MLIRLVSALRAESRAWRIALINGPLLLLLLVMLVSLGLIAQRPLLYTFDVGLVEGYKSDAAYLRGFNGGEADQGVTFRWTGADNAIVLPALGQRALVVRFDLFPLPASLRSIGPQQVAVSAATTPLATLPMGAERRRFALLVPPYALSGGQLVVRLQNTTFSPAGDPRQLGVPLVGVTFASLTGAPLVIPAWGVIVGWLAALVLGWAMLLRVSVPEDRLLVYMISGSLAGLICLAALLDPPLWGLGMPPALWASCLGYGLTLLLRWGLPVLSRQVGIAPDRRRLGWLTLIMVFAFMLRYGGRLYPESMIGDINFHYNRFTEMNAGWITLLSRNRGVDFPYPPGPYLLIAPLTLLGFDVHMLLQIGAALADSLGAALVYLLTLLVQPRDERMAGATGLLAAALYVFTPAGFMMSWWSFDTHIYTQFFALLLMAVIALTIERQTPAGWWGVGIVAALVFLGHFGFLINVTLLGGMLIALLSLAGWRGQVWARQSVWPGLLAFLGAGSFALGCFYSAYLWLFLGQVQAVAGGGLTGLAGRAPVDLGRQLQVLWEVGIIGHFGFFPLIFAVAWVIGASRTMFAAPPTRSVIVMLMVATFAIGVIFALFPFLTRSTQSSRWLMFSAWAVALGGAMVLQRIWLRGWLGKGAAAAIGAYIVWHSAFYWLTPMLWRMRPPEPF